MSNTHSILPSPLPFLEELFDLLAEHHLDVSDLELDHICYRVETMERYSELKAIIPSFGRIGHTAIIGGREIMTVFLYVPIFFTGRAIHTLEIPAPKEGRVYQEGYEHAEFVIQESFESFQKRYPHLDFDMRGVSKPINPDMPLKLSDKISVKFHYSSLAYVVKYLES